MVSTGYTRAVRGTIAHLVSPTRGINALHTWVTQDFNLAMLAIQQGGPRRRISYPRPLEFKCPRSMETKVSSTHRRPRHHGDASDRAPKRA